jgi:sulfotransferase
MIEKLHAIAGLPRSGSTLLSALLRQNPRFAASMTSPLYVLIAATMEQMSPDKDVSALFDESCRRRIFRALFDGYYGDRGEAEVVFDTNRLWSGKMTLLRSLFPDVRVICCVRDVGWIIDSVERVLRQNALQTSRLFNFKLSSSVYARAQTLMNFDAGLIGSAWSALREAWFSEDADRIILVRYDSLVRDPQATIERIYRELGEPLFKHDFDNVEYDHPEFDAGLGMPGLHKVRSRVAPVSREPSIPPELFSRYADMSFWTKPENNKRGVTVL